MRPKKAFNPVEWRPESSFRVPERRWLRAQDLAPPRKRRGPFDDEWINHARYAIRGKRRSRHVLAIKHAEAIWSANSKGQRWEIEARILATQTDEEIAAAMHLSPLVVEAYQEIFFWVRPHLTATEWILRCAVGGLPCLYFAGAEQPSTVIKYMAYMGGPFAMEIARAVAYDLPLPRGVIRSTGVQALRDEAAVRIKVKALFRLWTAQSEQEAAEAIRDYDQASPQSKTKSKRAASSQTHRLGMVPAMTEFLAMLGRPTTPPASKPASVSPMQRAKAPAKETTKAKPVKPNTRENANESQDAATEPQAEPERIQFPDDRLIHDRKPKRRTIRRIHPTDPSVPDVD